LKGVGERATVAVANGQIVKPILKRVIGNSAVVTSEGRITTANQQSNHERVLAHLSSGADIKAVHTPVKTLSAT
jgi:hypothetical protein